MGRRLLSEVISLTPGDRDKLGLPTGLDKILPIGQVLASRDRPPVEPKKDRWSIKSDPERLARTFKFKDPRVQGAFIHELLDYEREHHHHGRITIEGDEITIEVWTHEIEQVTQIDIDYGEAVDEIYIDARYCFRG